MSASELSQTLQIQAYACVHKEINLEDKSDFDYVS
jgi:hypothetical protein